MKTRYIEYGPISEIDFQRKSLRKIFLTEEHEYIAIRCYVVSKTDNHTFPADHYNIAYYINNKYISFNIPKNSSNIRHLFGKFLIFEFDYKD
jgi:hypothetical protein